MKKRIITLSFALFAVGIFNVLHAQDAEKGEKKVDKKVLNWYNGKGAGMYTDKAYKKLKKKESTTVIVAVIDSGIDIEHEDLKGKIWVNEDEIPNNGIDDDNNGYVDDVHGWNFLGNSSGENVDGANLEKTRILRRLSDRFEGVDEASVSAADKSDYMLYKQVKKEVEEERANAEAVIAQCEQLMPMLDNIPPMVASAIGKDDYTLKDLEKWEPEGDMVQLKNIAISMKKGNLSKKNLEEAIKHFRDQLDYQLNTEFNERDIIGDNPDDFSDTNYGNNDVEGPDALHGTHVGGIIGAIRGNDLGGDGVASNVKLMSLRAVPNGDEADKDIALAIRYAVDNGASVINMSFGKSYSIHKKEVYEALQYASSKGVLLVHAAGNDAADVDVEPNFPTYMYSFQKERLPLYLTIGASTRDLKEHLAAGFSNYGDQSVDVFAPGFEIWNSVPQSDYKLLQGTSMAAPMVTGVAAMLKSYFPSLSMEEIKDIMLKSAKSYTGTMQVKPGTEEEVDFATLSQTGAVIDVLAAVKMCMELEKQKAG